MKKLFFIALLGAMCFVGCQNDDDATFTNKIFTEKSADDFELSLKEQEHLEGVVSHMIGNNLKSYLDSRVECSGMGGYLEPDWKITKTIYKGHTIYHKVTGYHMWADDSHGGQNIFIATKIELLSIDPLVSPC